MNFITIEKNKFYRILCIDNKANRNNILFNVPYNTKAEYVFALSLKKNEFIQFSIYIVNFGKTTNFKRIKLYCNDQEYFDLINGDYRLIARELEKV